MLSPSVLCSLAVLLLAPALLAACGGTETVTVMETETETVTTTETVSKTVTVTKEASPPPPRVFVPSFDSLLYKPDLIGLGASSRIEEIRWSSYGGATAVGRGTFPSNDCNPSCAGGKITPIPVTVKLTRRSLCRGELAYELMAIVGGPFDGTFDAIPNATACGE